MRMIELIGVAAACMLLASCSMLGVRQPEVSVKTVRFLSADFDKVALAVDLNVQNPNNASATLLGYDYTVAVDKQQMLSGTQDKTVTIQANSNSIVAVPLTLNFDDLFKIYDQLKGQEDFGYKVQCGLRFAAPLLGSFTVPVACEGRLPVIKLPEISVDGFTLKKTGLTGADGVLKLRVTNPNKFNVLLQSIDYGLAVNGLKWADGRTATPMTITENGESVVAIPVSLSYLELGATVSQALLGNKPLAYALTGTVDLRTSSPLIKHATLPLAKTGTLRIGR